MLLLRNMLNGVAALAFTTIILIPDASAKDFVADPPKCANSYGSIYVDKGADTAAWQAAGVTDPAGFLEAMVAESGCFTVTNSRRSAKYILTAGLLTKDQYRDGKAAFQSQDIPGSTPGAVKGVNKTLGKINNALASINSAGRGNRGQLGKLVKDLGGLLGSGNMRYGYLQINHNKGGELIGRGFARNNRSTLSYAHWSRPTDPQKIATQSFNSDKNSKLIGGALVLAYFDLHKEMPSLFASESTSKPISTGAPSGAITVKHPEELHAANYNIPRHVRAGRGGLVNSAGQCSVQTGTILRPDNFKTVYDKLKAGGDASQKSKYETQAQYEERIRSTGVKSYAIVGKPFSDKELIYDAENELFLISDMSVKRLKASFSRMSYWVDIEREHKKVGKVRMRNGWGKTWTEDVLEGYVYRIRDRDALKSDRDSRGTPRYGHFTFFKMDTGKNYFEEKIVLPIPRNIAAANDGKIRPVFIVTPKGKYTHFRDHPETKIYTMFADVHCMVFLDKDSRVMKAVPTVYRINPRSKGDPRYRHLRQQHPR